MPGDHPPCQTVCRSDGVDGLGETANIQFATVGPASFFVFFGLFVRCTGRTDGPILTIYTSYDVFPRKDVPLGFC